MSLKSNNLSGGGGELSDVTVSPGTASEQASVGTTTHTHTSVACDGPASIGLVTWTDANQRTLNSATWGGVSCTIDVQEAHSGGDDTGAAIISIPGAQSGDIVLTFDAACDSSRVKPVGVANLQSLTPVDTDTDDSDLSGNQSTGALDALTEPAAGGVEFAVMSHANFAAISWTPADPEVILLENAQYDSIQSSCAYRLGGAGTGDITWSNGSSGSYAIVGASYR